MIQIHEGVSLEIFFCVNIMAIHSETLYLTYVICGIHVILLSTITPMYLISPVTVNIEPPTTKFKE